MASQALPVNQVNIKPFLTGHIPTSVKLSNVTLFTLVLQPLLYFFGGKTAHVSTGYPVCTPSQGSVHSFFAGEFSSSSFEAFFPCLGRKKCQ